MRASYSLPTEVEYLLSEAVRLRQAGALGEATAAFQQIVSIKPDFAEVHNELGNLLCGQGKFDPAKAHFQRAVALRPDFASAFHNLANLHWKQRELEAALVCFEQVAVLLPDNAEAHNNVANVLALLGRLEAAAMRFVQALALNPRFHAAHNNLANVLRRQGKPREAMVQYRRALELKPDYADAHNNLANVLRDQGQFDEAVRHLHTALTLDPQFVEAYRNLGLVLTDLGKLDEARAQFDRVLALDPSHLAARIDRAGLKTFSPGDPELAELETIATQPRLPPLKKLRLHFLLGKAWEDVGQYDRAFQHWIAGNALKRSQIDFDEAAQARTFQRIRELIDSDLLSRFAGAGHPASTPIFIVGMPRSGTTLVEQILASHPQVHGAGELPHLMHLAGNVRDTQARQIPYPEFLSSPPSDGLNGLGQMYLAQLPPLPPGKTRITDKMPGNFRFVGLIRLILPNAKIIHVMRNPVDTCVSCFKHLFGAGQSFSYDLGELGRAYCRYHALMEHWRRVLPSGAMLDVRYEDVVDNLAEQAQRMLEFCGLPWDDACLRFYQSDRPVQTLSNLQVRQPLYRKAIGRWHHYEAHLAPLLAELAGLAGS